MIKTIKKDKNNNIIYESHMDGYEEFNTYNENNKLIRSECHYSNGLVEIEHYKNEMD